MSKGDEVTQDDLKKLIEEEVHKFIAENRDRIIRRAHKRLRELRGKSGS